ncbi:MAG: hypothetical protein QMD04_08750 [Anaerolineales bacterium]|nr:hypothetical protein [Anaerolineales bacterium]
MYADPKPWEMQPWDTPGSFRAFREFYLAQEPPRSVNEAYRRARLKRGILETRSKVAPGRWQYWSRGQDNDGKPIPGALSWQDRANAWDKHLAEIANAQIEARWRKKIMGDIEVLGRLSEHGRIDIGIFIREREMPLRDGDGNPVKDADGNILTYATWDINLEMVKKYGHLIKSISSTRYGPKIEMHDGQTALVQLGRHHKLFTDSVDLTTGGRPLQSSEHLSDEQLRNTIQQLSEIGMALTGGTSLPTAERSTAGDDPAGQGDEPADA